MQRLATTAMRRAAPLPLMTARNVQASHIIQRAMFASTPLRAPAQVQRRVVPPTSVQVRQARAFLQQRRRFADKPNPASQTAAPASSQKVYEEHAEDPVTGQLDPEARQYAKEENTPFRQQAFKSGWDRMEKYTILAMRLSMLLVAGYVVVSTLKRSKAAEENDGDAAAGDGAGGQVEVEVQPRPGDGYYIPMTPEERERYLQLQLQEYQERRAAFLAEREQMLENQRNNVDPYHEEVAIDENDPTFTYTPDTHIVRHPGENYIKMRKLKRLPTPKKDRNMFDYQDSKTLTFAETEVLKDVIGLSSDQRRMALEQEEEDAANEDAEVEFHWDEDPTLPEIDLDELPGDLEEPSASYRQVVGGHQKYMLMDHDAIEGLEAEVGQLLGQTTPLGSLVLTHNWSISPMRVDRQQGQIQPIKGTYAVTANYAASFFDLGLALRPDNTISGWFQPPGLPFGLDDHVSFYLQFMVAPQGQMVFLPNFIYPWENSQFHLTLNSRDQSATLSYAQVLSESIKGAAEISHSKAFRMTQGKYGMSFDNFSLDGNLNTEITTEGMLTLGWHQDFARFWTLATELQLDTVNSGSQLGVGVTWLTRQNDYKINIDTARVLRTKATFRLADLILSRFYFGIDFKESNMDGWVWGLGLSYDVDSEEEDLDERNLNDEFGEDIGNL